MYIPQKKSYFVLISVSLHILLLGLPFKAIALLSGGALGGERPRILVSTDTARLASASQGGPFEVDDHQSMVRFLLYSDMFDVEGIVHTTAISNRGLVETVTEIIDKYELDYPNLKSWSSSYPTPANLRAVTVQGATWAPRAPSSSYSNTGSRLIVQKANNGDSRPLWILLYGKITDLAQALFDDPTIKDKIRVIGGYQNFLLDRPVQPNDDAKAIAWIQKHHPDLYFIESLETLKSTAFAYSGFTYYDSNRFMKDNIQNHGALGNHMWVFRKQDAAGNPASYSGWVRLGDDPTLNYLLSGDFNDPTADHWGGRFESANDMVRPNYYRDITPVSEAQASGRKFHQELLNNFATRLDRARYLNKVVNSDFEQGMKGWAFGPGSSVVWGAGHTRSSSTKIAKLSVSPESTSMIDQTVQTTGDETYTITGWLRPVSVTGTTTEVWGYWQTPHGEIPEKISGSFAAGNGAWAFVWRQLRAPIEAVGLRIAFTTSLGTGSVYFDDWTIVEGKLSLPIGQGRQLLSNGTFANDMRYWEGRGAKTEWIIGQTGDTTRAGKLTLSPDTYSSISQTVSTSGEKVYTFTGRIKPVALKGTVKMWAYWQTPNGIMVNSISGSLTHGDDTWIYMWRQLSAPTSATSVRVCIEGGTGTGEVYVDDVEVWGP